MNQNDHQSIIVKSTKKYNNRNIRYDNDKFIIQSGQILRDILFNKFNECPIDQLDLSQLNDLSNAFSQIDFSCVDKLIITLIENLDVSKVTFLNNCFYQAKNIPAGIGNWDTSSVIDMTECFVLCDVPSSVGNWDTSSVTDMTECFAWAENVPASIGKWNTSNVTSLRNCFSWVENVPASIGKWNTNSVTDMKGCFYKVQNIPSSIKKWKLPKITD